MKKIITLLIAMVMANMVNANNISISNVSLTGINTTDHYAFVNFNISWDNSWRTSSAPNNWDAAWVFVKYKVNGDYVSAAGATSTGTTITVGSTTGLRVGMRVCKSAGTGVITEGTVVTAIIDGTSFTVSIAPTTALSGGLSVVRGYAIWEHAILNGTGHTAPTGSTITPASDGTGVFIYRSSDGTGTNTFTNAQLRWNYGAEQTEVDIRVFAIEMVYVPEGSFYVGSGGTETGSFTNGSWLTGATIPLLCSSENALTISQTTGNLWATKLTLISAGSLAADYPKGYNAFYCMKYEVTQQMFVDFLNTLTYTQQTTMGASPNSLIGYVGDTTYRYKIYRSVIGTNSYIPAVYTSPSNSHVACKLSWVYFAAYLDWSGLRPMTELEYEKACRGPETPVPNEFPWGNTGIVKSTYTINDDGSTNESIGTNYQSNSTNYVSSSGAVSSDLTIYTSSAGATSSTTVAYTSTAGATSSGTTVIVASTMGLLVGMPVSVTSGTGVFAAGTYVTVVLSPTLFTVSASPTTALSGGATVVTGYSATVRVVSTTGLQIGTPVSVTGGTGSFRPGAVVTGITSSTIFSVSIAPTISLSNSAIVTGTGASITVNNTTELSIGMPVRVTAGIGQFAPSTVVTEITDGTHFKVSAPPTTPLSGGTSVVTGYQHGNAVNSITYISGPLRGGIFAGTSGNSGRVTAGATYYGIMEMAGNLFERIVSTANIAGQSFTGMHGDGILNPNGNATVDYWPGINGNGTGTSANTTYGGITGVTQGAGIGLRGGNNSNDSANHPISNRVDVGATGSAATSSGHGVRTAP